MHKALHKAFCLLLLILIGCDSQSPVVPYTDGVTRIEIRTQSDSTSSSNFRGFRGETCTLNLSFICWDDHNQTVPFIPVELSIIDPEPWKGTVTAFSDSTDINGELIAVYSVELQQSGDVTIQARCGNLVETKIIEIDVLPAQPTLRIERPALEQA